jgi:hypothetical protein
MQVALTLALTLVLVLLSGLGGLLLLGRFLTSETAEDRMIGFDPLPPVPLSVRLLDTVFLKWRQRPLQLTYRRDQRGRFRKLRR